MYVKTAVITETVVKSVKKSEKEIYAYLMISNNSMNVYNKGNKNVHK
jgi:hypothetical protein